MKNRTLFFALLSLSALSFSLGLWQTMVQHQAARSATRLSEQCSLQQEQAATAASANAALEQAITALREQRTSAAPSPAPTAEQDREMQRAKAAAFAEGRRRQQIARIMYREQFLRPEFEQLGLSQAQWEAFEKLSTGLEETLQATPPSGLSRDELAGRARTAREGFETRASALLGSETFQQLKDFQSREARSRKPAYMAARELQDALRFSGAPLESSQAARLISLIEGETKEPAPPTPAVLSDATTTQVAQFLSAPQLAAWKRVQAVHTATAELNDLMRKHAAATSGTH